LVRSGTAARPRSPGHDVVRLRILTPNKHKGSSRETAPFADLKLFAILTT
jgi:hypothetical protein